MSRYEFKKFPVLGTILTLLALFTSVMAISISLMTNNYDGTVSLALLELSAAVLFLAGLTTSKTVLLRVISIIATVGVLFAAFVLSIVKYGQRDVFLFGIALLMLITSILDLVYFLTVKNPRIEKFYFIASIALAALIGCYAIVYVVQDIVRVVNSTEPTSLKAQYYALIIAYGFVSILPMVIYQSMQKVDDSANKPAVEDNDQ